MGVISRLEGGLDSAFDRAAGAVFRGPIEPAQIAKRAEKQMNREKLVGAGKQYAPTLYTVLVNVNDDRKLFAFYPTMAAEIETYLVAKGTQNGLKFDGRPLVRFIVDKNLKSGKFDIIAENVSAPTIAQLRKEEQEYYGLVESKPSSLPLGSASRQKPGNVAASDAAALGASALGAAGSESDNAGFDDMALDGSDYDESRHDPSPILSQARLTDMNAGKSYAFAKSPMILGRDASCDITITDANISRRHVQFLQDVVGTWKIVDLDSTNGTKLNGSRITTALLRDGDQITLGVTVLEFRER